LHFLIVQQKKLSALKPESFFILYPSKWVFIPTITSQYT